jgi:hypothetical protein
MRGHAFESSKNCNCSRRPLCTPEIFTAISTFVADYAARFGAIDFLDKWLKAEHRIFEYRTGGSTIFFARRGRELVSVENDPNWLLKTQNAVTNAGLTNVRIVMEPDTRTPSAATSPYCRTLDTIYDLVLVDSFCNWPEADLRAPCFARAEKFIAPGGIIVLDDPLMCPVVPTRANHHLSFRG